MLGEGHDRRRWFGLPRVYWLLWAGTLVNRLGGFVFTFLALYLTEARGFSPVDAGIAVSCFGAGSFAASALGGTLADRKGRRFGLLFGTIAGAASILVLGAAEGTWAVRVAAFVAGLLGDSYRASIHAAVADVTTVAERMRAYAILYWAVNLGFTVSASSAGWLTTLGYHWLFIGDAATTLVFTLTVYLWFPETKPFAPAEAPPPTSWWRPFLDPSFARFAFAQLIVLVVFMQGQVSLPLDMRAHGIGPEAYGTLIALNGVIILVVQPLSTRVLKDRPLGPVLAGGAALVGLGFGLNAVASGSAGFAVAIVVWTLGEILMASAAPAFISLIAPTHARGVYQGAHGMLWGASFAVAPLVGTAVLERASANALWVGCLVACGIAAVVHLGLVVPKSAAE